LNQRAAELQAEYEAALRIENLLIKYNQHFNQVNLWLEATNETLSDPINTDTVAAVEELQKVHNAILAEQPTIHHQFNEVNDLFKEIQTHAVHQLEKVPGVSILNEKWTAFLADVESRGHALHAEMARQQANEKLRVEFAEKAKLLNSLTFEENSAIHAHVSGDLDEQLANVQKHKPEILKAQSELDALEALHHRLQEAQVFHNPHTDLNYPTLKTNYDQLVKAANAKESLIQKEIIHKSNSLVSPQQVAEFKEVFMHFDKDKNNTLSRLEFKSCLQSLGEDPTDAQLDSLIASIGTEGRIDFESFVTFMSNKAADSETQGQIIEAFKSLSGDAECITEEQMRRALPSEKVDYLVKNMPLYHDKAGAYDYTAWAKQAFN